MLLHNDDEILQEFIVKAGETLVLLSEQVAELKNNPTDTVLLNAIFCGFHTIRGGAEFLSLTNLMNICHLAANVFKCVQKCKRNIDTSLIELIFQVINCIHAMIDVIKRGETPEAAKQSLVDNLKANITDTVTVNTKNDKNDLITEEEFETLLDTLHDSKTIKPSTTNAAAGVASNTAKVAEIPQPMTAKNETLNIKEDQGTRDKAKLVQQGAPKKDGKNVNYNLETTVRVDINKLDQIMNMVGELVLVRNRLVKLKNSSDNQDIINTVDTLDIVTTDLQASIMKTRMQPIKKIFGRFPNIMRDFARSLKKEVNLEIIGGDTELDKNLVEALADPLVHLVKNAVDHGIELPEDRIKLGKPRTGKISLFATQEGDHIILSIEDDGKGMDPNKLRQHAIENGLFTRKAAARLSEQECFELIFLPGFSTKKEVSDISGRGVGMDVVKTKIMQLNGSLEITSMMNQGSKFKLKIPLTLAILPTLMVIVGKQSFALPLACVNEIFDLNLQHTNMVDGQLVIVVRNKIIPLFYLKKLLHENHEVEKNNSLEHVVIVSIGIQKVGFVVDKLLGQEEVVIKSLSNILHGTKGIAGATITGDGNIAVILDIPNLLKKHTNKNRKAICL